MSQWSMRRRKKQVKIVIDILFGYRKNLGKHVKERKIWFKVNKLLLYNISKLFNFCVEELNMWKSIK